MEDISLFFFFFLEYEFFIWPNDNKEFVVFSSMEQRDLLGLKGYIIREEKKRNTNLRKKTGNFYLKNWKVCIKFEALDT